MPDRPTHHPPSPVKYGRATAETHHFTILDLGEREVLWKSYVYFVPDC